jgi:hypothetical protein
MAWSHGLTAPNVLSRFGRTLRKALDELASWGKRNSVRYGAIIEGPPH